MVWYLPFLLCDLSFGGLCVGLLSILDSCLHLGANCNPVSFVYMRLSSFQPRGLERLSLLRVCLAPLSELVCPHTSCGVRRKSRSWPHSPVLSSGSHTCAHTRSFACCPCALSSSRKRRLGGGPVLCTLGSRGGGASESMSSAGVRGTASVLFLATSPLPRPACQGLCQGSLCWLLCTSFWGRRRLEKVRV